MTDPTEHETGSGSVFADLGFPDFEVHQLKARLVQKISAVMHERGLSEMQAAELIGMGQRDVSEMLRGRFREAPVEGLLRHLVALGQDVEIVVRPPHGDRGAAAITVI